MSLRWLLSRLLVGLLPLAVTTTVYLYLYPVFSGCAYPLPLDPSNASSHTSAFLHTLQQHVVPQSAPEPEPAIFRLLVLADPQLEGDSSLPRPQYKLGARLQKHWNDTLTSITATPYPVPTEVWRTVLEALQSLIRKDIPRALSAVRKRLDLLGNDYYLAHIYRTLHWWTRPTHVTVLGDLIGSQWVTDEEFQRRGERYWHRVFRGGKRVSDQITRTGEKDYATRSGEEGGTGLEELPSSPSWAHRIINIVGNHDVGYSGDASEKRIERFEHVFGRANWDIRFQHPHVGGEGRGLRPTLHLINLNSLTLDGPPFSHDVQGHSYAYINDVISHRSYPVDDPSTFTLLLTHLPLHKQDGVCTDGPYFTYFDADDEREDPPRWKAGGLREQNHLSEHVTTNGILEGLFGMSGDEGAVNGGIGRNGLILTGHDHTGCDVVHSIHKLPPPSNNNDLPNINDTVPNEDLTGQLSWAWNATRYNRSKPHNSRQPSSAPSIREITLRSMMGEYGGNAGLLSLWFDSNATEWKYAISMCPAGVQHIWWAVHVVDLITLIVAGLYVAVSVVGAGRFGPSSPRPVVGGDKKTR